MIGELNFPSVVPCLRPPNIGISTSGKVNVI